MSAFDLLRGVLGPGPTRREAPSERLSVALLLTELARADFQTPEVELQRIRELLMQRYQLDSAQAAELLEQARATDRDAVSLFDYVQTLNTRLDRTGKRELMDMLWQVAYADGRLDKHEDHLLRKLAALLYVSDEDYIKAKLAASDG
jgi:uncharacterized tellurite resistance protein B-like protein